MPRPDHYEEGLHLISGLLDGSISDADFDRLHEMLAEDPSLRHLYMQSVDQEVELSFRPPEASNVVVFPMRWFPRPALAAAVILLIASLIFFLVNQFHDKRNGKTAPPGPIVESPKDDPSPPPPDQGQSPDPPPPSPAVLADQRPVPAAPGEWVIDFESGLPPGWDAEFASADLPAGSSGAARTITKTNSDSGDIVTYRQIIPPMAWGTGHFTIHDDTHLHLTFKTETSGWLDIFMMTHVSDPKRPDGMMYKFDDERLWAEEGTWQTASIPLASFMGKDLDLGHFVDNLPPQAGEIAWQLFFSAANNDLQMVIDEIRVDRNGPGEIVFADLE